MATASALTIVNRSLQSLGLPQVATLVSALDDQTGFQAAGLLNELGDQIVKAHDWQFLEKHLEIVGDGSTTEFPMPDDFGRVVNQTQWASSMRRPMYGPLTPQGWSWVQFGIVSVGVYYRYRFIDNKFCVFPTPAAGEKFHFYYISKNWVKNPLDGTYRDEIQADTDEPVFDYGMMIAGTKAKLWSAKGMEATGLWSEFNYMLGAEKGQNQGAGVIALDQRWEYLYISSQNVPDGSWNV